MPITFGVEGGGTPNGDRKSLERLAKEVNERERQKWLAEQKRKQDEARQIEANKAKGY